MRQAESLQNRKYRIVPISPTRIRCSETRKGRDSNELLDDHRALEPPDPIPNSAVKRRIADGSVGFPHVRVGHRQALFQKTPA